MLTVKSTLWLLLSFICCCTFLLAEDEPIYTVDFRVLGWDRASRDLYYLAGAERKPILASVSRPSSSYHYSGPSPLKLYREGPNAGPLDENGDPLPVGILDLTQTPGQFLMLIGDDPRQQNRLKLIALPDLPQQRQGGMVRFVNMTAHPMVCRLNDGNLRIEPGAIQSIQSNPSADNILTMRIAMHRQENWERVFSTVFGHQPNQHTTIFIHPDTQKNNGITFRKITETIKE